MSRKAEVLKESAKVIGRAVETKDEYGWLKVEAKIMVEFEVHDGHCRDCGWDEDDMRHNPVDHFRHCYKSTRLVG